jgi:hypothetical protein
MSENEKKQAVRIGGADSLITSADLSKKAELNQKSNKTSNGK